MKKVVISFIMGAVLATAGSVYAEDIKSLVGATIQGEIPVKVKGEKLEKNALIVNGTSYLPVRAIGDALDMEVKYDADLGVELTPKEVTTVETSATLTITPEDADAIKSSEEQIVIAEKRINDLQAKILKVDKDISIEQGKADATTGDTKTFHTENIKILNADKVSLNESLQSTKDSVISQQTYITKIKAKYQQ